MKIKFLGQNCFLMDLNGKTIITDPFYNYQKSESGFDITAQTIDFILITHAHGDHIADVNEVLEHHPNARIIGTPEVCGYFSQAENSIDLNIGGTTIIENVKISMVAAHHTSSFPNGSYGGVPVGYILRLNDGKNVYFAGDTGIMSEMELYPRVYGTISTAILPIGGHYTMCPELAVFAAAELLKTQKVIGCHFDTFPPIAINHEDAYKVFTEKGVDLVLPKVGEYLEI